MGLLIPAIFLFAGRAAAAGPVPPIPIVPGLAVGPCGLIQSDFKGTDHGNFEALVLEGHNLVHYFKVNTNVDTPWSRGPILSTQATGPGCLIQSDYKAGNHGNFEAVVLEGTNLVHYFKVNTSTDTPWQRGAIITSQATGPGCIIQSDFKGGDHGNFEVVVQEGTNLVHYYKINTSTDTPWQRGAIITSQATGPGCIIQSDFKGGDHGNFEVVVQEGSNLVHYFKINTSIDTPWQRGPVITTQATGPGTLIQSDFSTGGRGDLEVLVPEGSRLAHYFFADLGSGRRWMAGQTVTSAAAGPAALIQSDYQAGGHGNFEVLAAVADPACHTSAPCIRQFFHVNDNVSNPWQGGPIAAYTGRSQKICQVTGETDREWGFPTVTQSQRVGVWGTDLGIVAEHKGRIYSFFGDTISTIAGDKPNGDSYTYTYDRTPEDCLQLTFAADDQNWWRALTIPTVDLGAMETPTGAFSANGKLYVFVQTAWNPDVKRHGFSVLAHSLDDGTTFERVQIISFDRFINISPLLAAAPGTSTLPAEAGLWLFASGKYRGSPIYLAWLPLRAVDDNPRQALRFFAGFSNGAPQWSSNENDAQALTDQPCVGELASTWNDTLHRYLLLYNCDNPRGINLRAARQPWGPWSAPTVIFDPSADGGYCHFMHNAVDNCDRVNDPNRQGDWGGEYGPYVIPSLTRSEERQTTLYYYMSTWNPYEVMLMRTTLQSSLLLAAHDLVASGKLRAGWEDWSWDTTVSWEQQDVLHGESPAAQVRFTKPFAGFSLRTSTPLTTANFSALDFWIYGATGGSKLAVYIQQTGDGAASPAATVEAPADTWTHVSVPLADLGSPAQIARITLQEAAGTAQPPFYVDAVALAPAEDQLQAPGAALYLPLLKH